jgi:hypothetical protein
MLSVTEPFLVLGWWLAAWRALVITPRQAPVAPISVTSIISNLDNAMTS